MTGVLNSMDEVTPKTRLQLLQRIWHTNIKKAFREILLKAFSSLVDHRGLEPPARCFEFETSIFND